MANQEINHSPPLTEYLKMAPEMVGIRVNEEPNYEILKKEGEIEVRRYEKILLAQISINKPHEEAVKEGFQKLADYIFGGNAAEEKMAMTSPDHLLFLR